MGQGKGEENKAWAVQVCVMNSKEQQSRPRAVPGAAPKADSSPKNVNQACEICKTRIYMASDKQFYRV